MGRKSALSADQWVEVGKRLLDGDTPERISADLTSKGSKVSPSSIREHFKRKGQSTKTVQQMAGEVFNAEQAVRAAEHNLRTTHKALQAMPAAAQVATITLVQRMRSMSESLAEAADLNAKTALGFAAKANSQQLKIDDADPMKSGEALASSVVLLKASNEAAKLPTALIAAAGNRDLINRAHNEAKDEDDEVITPERMREGARRLAFLLHRAAAPAPEST